LGGGNGTARETGGSMPIAVIGLGKAAHEGFELDDDILTVFERLEVVWPLDGGYDHRADFSLDLMRAIHPTSN
jgi:hypothetical protein